MRCMGRPAGACAIVVAALISMSAVRATAADTAERPYDPPVCSRWIIESETSSDEVKPDGPQTSLIKSRAELTIEQKTSDGFRIS